MYPASGGYSWALGPIFVPGLGLNLRLGPCLNRSARPIVRRRVRPRRCREASESTTATGGAAACACRRRAARRVRPGGELGVRRDTQVGPKVAVLVLTKDAKKN